VLKASYYSDSFLVAVLPACSKYPDIPILKDCVISYCSDVLQQFRGIELRSPEPEIKGIIATAIFNSAKSVLGSVAVPVQNIRNSKGKCTKHYFMQQLNLTNTCFFPFITGADDIVRSVYDRLWVALDLFYEGVINHLKCNLIACIEVSKGAVAMMSSCLKIMYLHCFLPLKLSGSTKQDLSEAFNNVSKAVDDFCVASVNSLPFLYRPSKF
jgi:hypothetical protein